MLDYEDAIARLLALAPLLPSELLPLGAAAGRVLASPVIASADAPPFDQSAMDGYAVRASAFVSPPFAFPVAFEAQAGSVSPPLGPSAAARIFTGAEVPEGADTVVMQEEAARSGDVVTFVHAPARGTFVRRRGEDARAGDVLVREGTRLRPSHLGLLAGADALAAHVRQRPRVTIVATGDELRGPGEHPRPGSIVDTLSPALRSSLESAGAEIVDVRRVRDSRSLLEEAFREAVNASDVVVAVGGMSVGDHDHVRPVLHAMGADLDFFRVAIKPGKPLAVGTLDRASSRAPSRVDLSGLATRPGKTIIVGLPGNPVSALLTAGLFVRPLLGAMQGDLAPRAQTIRVCLDRAVDRTPGRLEFARARLMGGGRAAPLPNQASGALTALAEADIVVLYPPGRARLEAGEELEAILLRDLGV